MSTETEPSGVLVVTLGVVVLAGEPVAQIRATRSLPPITDPGEEREFPGVFPITPDEGLWLASVFALANLLARPTIPASRAYWWEYPSVEFSMAVDEDAGE